MNIGLRSKIGKRALAGALVQVLAAGTWLAASQLPANAAPWSTGDVFAAVSDGQYKQYASGATDPAPVLDTLQVSTPGYVLTGPGVTTDFRGYTGQCAFNPALAAPFPT